MPEIIYVFTNEEMPGLVKIGRTTESVEARIAQLSSHSGVPIAFECHFTAEVANAAILEKKLHQLFSESRVNTRREFFRVDPEKVVLAISIGQFTEITPGQVELEKEEQEALERVKARRPRINLEAIGIKPGDTLLFSRDESIVATVIEDGKVVFQGEELSLSAAALKAVQSQGSQTTAVSGSDYWKFEGELLDERRRRLESEQFDERRTNS